MITGRQACPVILRSGESHSAASISDVGSMANRDCERPASLHEFGDHGRLSPDGWRVHKTSTSTRASRRREGLTDQIAGSNTPPTKTNTSRKSTTNVHGFASTSPPRESPPVTPASRRPVTVETGSRSQYLHSVTDTSCVQLYCFSTSVATVRYRVGALPATFCDAQDVGPNAPVTLPSANSDGLHAEHQQHRTGQRSLSWSYRGRRVPGCSPTHKSEANCPKFALAWYERIRTVAR
jgi:hypothetical protein